MPGTDTRITLVREDTATRRRIKKALVSAKEDAFLSIDVQVDAILAELFPETDKPLKLSHLATRSPSGDFRMWVQHPHATRIEEELNRV